MRCYGLSARTQLSGSSRTKYFVHRLWDQSRRTRKLYSRKRAFPSTLWENYLPKPNDSKVLIVDDICDSGETFERLSNYIKENINHECEVRFSALWWNNECDFEPHYYTRDLAKDTEDVWIFFPHENWWEEGSIS